MAVRKNFTYNSILLVSQYLIPMLTYPYISRIFGIEKMGLINWVDNTINYFTLISTMGINVIGIRETARHKNNTIKLSKTFSDLLTLHLTMALAGIVLYITFIKIYSPKEANTLMYIGTAKIFFNALLIEWYYKGSENFKFITTRSIIIKIVYSILIFFFIKETQDYTVYFILTCTIVALNSIINCWHVKKSISFSLYNINFRKYIKSIYTIGIYLILTSMYTTFNVMYLGIFSTNKALGSYTTALKIYTIVLGLFTALNSALLPKLNFTIEKGDYETFYSLIEKSLLFIVTTSIPVIIFGITLGSEIIFLIAGPGYNDAIDCFRIILPLIFIVGFAQVFSNQILMSLKKDKQLMHISCLGAILGVALNIILVPKYNEIGSSIVIALSEISITVALYINCYRLISLLLPWKLVLLNLINSLPYVLICWSAKIVLKSELSIITFSFILSIIYFIFSNIYLLKNSYVIYYKEQFIKVLFKNSRTV